MGAKESQSRGVRTTMEGAMVRLGGAQKTSILLWPVSCRRRRPLEVGLQRLRHAFG